MLPIKHSLTLCYKNYRRLLEEHLATPEKKKKKEFSKCPLKEIIPYTVASLGWRLQRFQLTEKIGFSFCKMPISLMKGQQYTYTTHTYIHIHTLNLIWSHWVILLIF